MKKSWLKKGISQSWDCSVWSFWYVAFHQYFYPVLYYNSLAFCALHYAILKNNYHNIGYCLVLVGVYSVKWCFQTTCASLLLKITHRSYEVNVCLMLSSFLCQVSQKSPNLTVFKGYVMKLRLNCTKYPILSSSNKTRTKDFCLLFKVKGEVQCKYC